MSKTTVVRRNEKLILYRTYGRPKGRGSKFQPSTKATYTIVNTSGARLTESFKTREEADKGWVYCMLRYL
jgi:hypothetical protein